MTRLLTGLNVSVEVEAAESSVLAEAISSSAQSGQIVTMPGFSDFSQPAD